MHARRSERGSTTAAALGVVAAVIGLVTAVLGLVPSLRPWDGGGASATRDPVTSLGDEVEQARRTASVFLNRDSGPGGTEVKVSGEGFTAGERVELRFHTTDIGTTTANGDGRFSNVVVTIPGDYGWSAPHQYDVVASGTTSSKSARAPFTLTG